MQRAHLIKAGILALLLSLVAVLSWEFYLRKAFYTDQSGLKFSYDDNEALWADKRAMVYEPTDQATVFIGSSRMRFDIDIPLWQRMTGEHAIQLALDGGDPRPVLADLANDKNFKGKLLVDVTEGIFFYKDEPKKTKQVTYYHNITPTQRFSFRVDRFLESQLVFLDQENFSLNSLLNHLKLPRRAGVIPEVVWPVVGTAINYDRQEYFTPAFLADSTKSNKTKSIWKFFYKEYPDTPVTGKKLDSLILRVKGYADKIKARGGQVIFVRTPSCGWYKDTEDKDYPRKLYWDRLLELTGCQGVYFEDYPATAHFICPEWSHLSPDDARIYTENLANILRTEKGWSFNKNTNTQ
jgi:hypothetical protein